jgi:hypothetical protein
MAQAELVVPETLDFVIERNLITYDGKFMVTFDVEEIPLKKYYVRPILSNGNIEIFDPRSGDWIRSGDVGSKMPLLQKDLFLKISSLEQNKHNLSFEIMNINTGEISKLKDINIYGKKVYDQYIDSVNMSIKGLQYNDEIPTGSGASWVQTNNVFPKSVGEVKNNNTPLLWIYVGSLTSFVMLLSFFIFLVKRSDRFVLR